MKPYKNSSISKIAEWVDSQDLSIIHETELSLNAFASVYKEIPPSKLKESILTKITTLNQTRQNIDLKNPPLLHENSNLIDWVQAVEGISPPSDFEEIHLEPIHANENVELFVAWVRKMVPEEVHHDLIESFLILEGSCTCHIENSDGTKKSVDMIAGDYISMNLGDHHDIEVTSDQPTKAILQWLKIAA